MTSAVGGDWRRLHPLTILKEMGALAWAIVAALAFDFDWEVSLPAVPEGTDPDSLIAVGVFGYAVVRYLFTAYRVTDQTIDLRRGVLVKTNQSMPRSRVQTVVVNTPLIGRFLGVSTVEVSAADTEDIRLSYVSASNADHLRRLLETDRSEAEEGAVAAETDRTLLAELPPGRLVLFALTEGGLAVAIVLLVVAVVVAVVVDFLLAPFVAVAVLGGWPVLRTVGLVGFRSWLTSDRVKVETGLLSRRETEAPLARIQSMGVSRPLFRRLLGLETVEMSTGELTISSENMVIKGMVAPLVSIGDWRGLAEQLIGRVDMGETDLRRSSPYTKRRSIIRGTATTLLVGVLLAGPAIWLDLVWLPFVIAVVGVGASVAYGLVRYRVLGWAVDQDHLIVRRGVMTRRVTVVPIHKVQDVSITETFFQRRLQIATVEIDIAGFTVSGPVRAIDLAGDDARRLADHLVASAARVALPDGV